MLYSYGMYHKVIFTIGRYFLGKHNKAMTPDRFLFIGRYKEGSKRKFDPIVIWNWR